MRRREGGGMKAGGGGMASDIDVQQAAAAIADDIAAGRTFRAPPGPPVADMAAAYAVQDALTALRGGAGAIGGFKLAFNGAAARAYYGLAEPCIAPVWRRDIRQDGATLRLAEFHALAIEPEIVLELGRDLDHRPGMTAADAMQAVAAIRPAIEVMDHRGAFAQDPPAALAVAQGIHSAGAVLGAPVPPARLAERHGIVTRLLIDGAEAGARPDGAPQDPAEGLVWAAAALAARGQRLRAGMILLCGTHLPVRTVAAPGRITVDMGGFGTVGFSLV
jgi:2-oxo-3-hexenedioate decarboxylase/2-keto-4-pentenoate hydratase